VFEEKLHRGPSRRSGEPREIKIGDVDGDGLDDVILIVHDRVIVYLPG
jgi:hypothetical protein